MPYETFAHNMHFKITGLVRIHVFPGETCPPAGYIIVI